MYYNDKLYQKLLNSVYEHKVKVELAENKLSKNKKFQLFMIDRSFLDFNFTSLAENSLEDWNKFLLKKSIFHRKRETMRNFPIKRLIPMLDPLQTNIIYTNEQISLIKYSLHYQLLFGIEILIYFTNNKNFLKDKFNTDNFNLILDSYFLSCNQMYDEEEKLIFDDSFNKSFINDISSEVKNLYKSKDDNIIKLKYDDYTFRFKKDNKGNTLRGNNKKRYGDFLFKIQNGKCAITGEKLKNDFYHVDHIHSFILGGNNSLINLQAVTPKANLEDKIKENRFIFNASNLNKYNLIELYHRILIDRKLNNIQLSNIKHEMEVINSLNLQINQYLDKILDISNI